MAGVAETDRVPTLLIPGEKVSRGGKNVLGWGARPPG